MTEHAIDNSEYSSEEASVLFATALSEVEASHGSVSKTTLPVGRRLLMLSYMVECVTTFSDLDADVVVVF
jgi:hypothetical protein